MPWLLRAGICSAFWMMASAPALEAALTSDEVAIVAVRSNAQSMDVAKYYAQARGIPVERICYLEVPSGKPLKREAWDKTVRPYLRYWLEEIEKDADIRCLVTVWDVPLKIEAYAADSPVVRDRLAFLRTQRRERIRQINEVLQQVHGLLTDEAAEPLEPLPNSAEINTIREANQKIFGQAQQRIAGAAKTPAVQEADAKLINLFIANGGLSVLANNLARRSQEDLEKNPELLKTFEGTKGRLLGLKEGFAALEALPESVVRDEQIVGLVQRAEGFIGSVQWIDNQLQYLGRNETYSSFDSELSMVKWPDYPTMRWVPNVLNHGVENDGLRRARPTYMVSRLEAPTVEQTKRLIDDALAVEKEGLTGKIYLDARGFSESTESKEDGSYNDYDARLRHLAKVLTDHGVEGVVLDNEKELFQAGDCPEAALYCGWYSHARYVDAFEWKRGSVGYHLASSEAVTLRKPGSEVWCKRMLDEGIAATIGPTYEPYLHAFPRPDEFFVLLLSGEFTLAECYWRTARVNSWVMVLVGDPLYNPYRASPKLSADSEDSFVRDLLNAASHEAVDLPER